MVILQIYLSHNLDRVTTQLPDNVEQRYGIDRVEGDDIILRDGSVIHADMIILATGYRCVLQSAELFLSCLFLTNVSMHGIFS